MTSIFLSSRNKIVFSCSEINHCGNFRGHPRQNIQAKQEKSIIFINNNFDKSISNWQRHNSSSLIVWRGEGYFYSLMAFVSINQPWPTRGPRAACGPWSSLEWPFYSLWNCYFGAKLVRSLEKVQILALKMAIFQKCGPWADLGWPWLL